MESTQHHRTELGAAEAFSNHLVYYLITSVFWGEKKIGFQAHWLEHGD